MRPPLRRALLALVPVALLLGLGASQVGRDATPPGIFVEAAERVPVGAPIDLQISASEPVTFEVEYGSLRVERVEQMLRLNLLAEAGTLPVRVGATDAAGNRSEAVHLVEGVPAPVADVAVASRAEAGDPVGIRVVWRAWEELDEVSVRFAGRELPVVRAPRARAESAPAPAAEVDAGSSTGAAASEAPASPPTSPPTTHPTTHPTTAAMPSATTPTSPDAAAPAEAPYSGEAWAFAAIPFAAPGGELRAEITLRDALGGERTLSAPLAVTANDLPVEELQIAPATLAVITPAGRALEAETLDAAYAAAHPQPLWREPFVTPIEGVGTSGYGWPRRYAPGGPVSYHQGEDIAAPAGTEIRATNRGVVRVAGMYPIKGGLVAIDHGAGVYSLYFHQQRIDVAVGDTVARGQPIGTVGSTGLSTGPHLHWEMRVGGVPTDPLVWVGALVP